MDMDAIRKRAELHASRQEWDKARDAFLELHARSPNDAATFVELSYVESLAGRYRSARRFALRAAEMECNDQAVIAELFARLRTFNAPKELHEYVNRLKAERRMVVRLWLSLAAQLSYFNNHEAALQALDEARRQDSSFPPTLIARAQVLIHLGRFDEAESEVLLAQRRAPDIPQGWLILSLVRKQKVSANHVDQIRNQLKRAGRPQDTATLMAALHKELDDIGAHRDAWVALSAMCRSKRGMLDYSPGATDVLIDALEKLPRRDYVNNASSRVPIFIVGMHRSGTTLLEHLLDGNRNVRGVGELYDFTSQMRYASDHHCKGVIDLTIVERSRDVDFEAVGEQYLQGMEWRLGEERFFTDKLPSNFLNIGFICQALPQAKILHMVRDPIETCFSNLRELFSDANPYSYDQLELADFYKQYRRLMAHWHQAYPGRILDVDYAELTRDTETVLRRVSAFCGFAFEPEMLALQNRKRGVATASAVQVRDKVVVREQPKWKPYEQYLQPLIQALRADGFVQ